LEFDIKETLLFIILIYYFDFDSMSLRLKFDRQTDHLNTEVEVASVVMDFGCQAGQARLTDTHDNNYICKIVRQVLTIFSSYFFHPFILKTEPLKN
jgi:hypothetical protein